VTKFRKVSGNPKPAQQGVPPKNAKKKHQKKHPRKKKQKKKNTTKKPKTRILGFSCAREYAERALFTRAESWGKISCGHVRLYNCAAKNSAEMTETMVSQGVLRFLKKTNLHGGPSEIQSEKGKIARHLASKDQKLNLIWKKGHLVDGSRTKERLGRKLNGRFGGKILKKKYTKRVGLPFGKVSGRSCVRKTGSKKGGCTKRQKLSLFIQWETRPNGGGNTGEKA